MKPLHVVGAVIVDTHQRILCAQRSERMTFPGLWEFPGGKIEESESPQEALVREISEELGCLIQVSSKIEEIQYKTEEIYICLHTFYATIVEGKPKKLEHSQIRWLTKDQLHTLEWVPADIPTVQTLETKKTTFSR